MATIVNNPGVTGESSKNSSAAMMGAILLVIAVLALIFFGRGGFGNTFQSGSQSGGGVSVPERVDVNVNTPQQ